MLAKNKKTLTLTSAVILLPIVWGLLLWNRLPLEITTQWNFYGQAGKTSSRSFVVFGMPLVMLAFQWFSILATALDPRNREQNPKPLKLMLWVIPVLSNLIIGIIYAVSLGSSFSPVSAIFLFLGILFVAIGNYLPKCRQNSTLGLRIPWTMASEANWNATHRLAGKVWVVGGAVMLLLAAVPPVVGAIVMLADVLVMTAVPAGYSYRFYRRQKATGDLPGQKGTNIP